MADENERIRTPDQRIRVFVSSTLRELAAERVAVRAAVERLHLTAVMFEAGARPHPPRELYRAYLRQSHVFVGIYAERYGWVAPGEEVSGLEDEFRLSAGLPRLLYVRNPTGEVEPRLRALLTHIRAEGDASYRRFRDAKHLIALVAEDLASLLSERFMLERTRSSGPHPPTSMTPLPVPLTPTVGRDHEVRSVTRLLDRGVRLLTITGTGGVGKSRLALEVAHAEAARFPDGIVLVRLEAVTRADAVLRTVAHSLHVPDGGSRPILDVLSEEVSERRLLLVIDNMEQVAAAGPDLAELLGRCPGLSALVTSRHSLRLRGECEYHLLPLPLPDDADETALDRVPSVELFVQRATAVAPGFTLTDANGPVIAEIVRLLDGLPLAIELAAARARLFPPAALLERLRGRLDVLAVGAHDLPPRQRTQRATLDWSYELLSSSEQALFVRMSVFVGNVTLDAISAVCQDSDAPAVEDTVSSLLEKSLLVSSVEDDALPRVRMLQTVRARAVELLGERGQATAMGARHARWYADLAEPADILRYVGAARHWPVLEADASNLLVAVQWAVESRDGALVVDLTRRLWPWLWASGRVGELRDRMLDALRSLPPDTDPREEGYLSWVAGVAQTLTGNFPEAQRLTERALQCFDRLIDPETPLLVGHARLVRGTLNMSLEHDDGVVADLDAAVEVGRREHNAWLLAYATSHRGMGRAMRGDTAGARLDHEESLTVATAMGHDVLVAQAMGQIAIVDLLEERIGDGIAQVRRQITHLQETLNLEGLANALDTAAALAAAERQWETAARTTGAAMAVRRQIHLAPWPSMQWHHETTTAAIHDQLGDRAEPLMTEAGSSDPWTVVDEALLMLRAARSTRGGEPTE